uniref:Uncharacterized protein n=1 Tax=Eutreptiella gymnastica TaxID=73025 RepID=A0A7S1IPI9_9EUGL|mmetsp:Transcript_33452/g.59950  ORF Transcript_33452/g.59950 Transcript_33452/m.59950 type:complete len:135 (+) Transcript_33452:76-480(+)
MDRTQLEREASHPTLTQLIENEFHSAWADTCVMIEAVIGPQVDRLDLLLLGMMDVRGDPVSFFPGRSLTEAAQQVQRPLPDPTTPVACTDVDLAVLQWAFAERVVANPCRTPNYATPLSPLKAHLGLGGGCTEK